jgi:hypothetical protein
MRGLLATVVAGLLALATLPGPALGATSGYRLDLGARSDFVAQTNFVQCVGASMQMMLNMIGPNLDRSAATQAELQRLARTWSGSRPDGRERQGASVRGWSAGLNVLGAGPYRLVGAATLQEAMQVAARAMRTTGKPVGLLVWRGRHAWVMSGFRASGDPLTGGRVTGAIIEDPLYPHGSSVWGPSPTPGATLTLKEVGRQFVARRRSTFAGALGGTYVLVLPYRHDVRILRMT